MREAVLMLYGTYSNDEGVVHPDQEDMFLDRPDLERQFDEHGVAFHIGRVLDLPGRFTGPNGRPRIEVAEHPIYDEHGTLLPETVYEECSIDEYPAVIDHWVANFQERVRQEDGSTLRVAHGLGGVPSNSLWNCRPIQEFGNSKLLMDTVLAESGCGVPTYATTALDALVQEHPNVPIFFKPVDGSLSKGTEKFATPQQVQRALREQRIAASGVLQPYLDLKTPMTGLRTPDGDSMSAEKLAAINTGERLLELRAHTMVYTDQHGNLCVEAAPTLKYSYPNTDVMKREGNIALAEDSITPYEYEIIKDLGCRVVRAAAAHSGELVTQYYGTFDIVEDKQGRRYIIDANCRGPRLTIESPVARRIFTRVIAGNARQNFAAAA